MIKFVWEKPRSFRECMVVTLAVGQVFALLPVDGVTGNGIISFSWKSSRVFYSAFLTLLLFFPTYACLHDVVTHEADIDRIIALVFFGNSICMHWIFFAIAKKWPKLMEEWMSAEDSMKTYGHPKNLNFQIKALTIVILSLTIIEHLVSVIGDFMKADELKTNDQDIFEYFFVVTAFPQVYALVEYSLWSGIILQIFEFISTFSWSFMDLFVMVMSVGLGALFREVADRVELYSKNQVTSESLWMNLRKDYARLSRLCRTLNDCISGLVALSFASNLFFILARLFHILKGINDDVSKVCFFISFGFLIVRVMCVCYYGAWIHDESTRPLVALNALPSDVYNNEVKRFTTHVCYDAPALTGKNFFTLSRGLILSIVSAIVTYELIMIQYFGTF